MDVQSLLGAEGTQNIDRKRCGNCSQVVSIMRKCFLDLIPFMIVLEPGEAIHSMYLVDILLVDQAIDFNEFELNENKRWAFYLTCFG